MENTSGTGSGATVPSEVDKWNWGAFLFTWIWGVGNSTYIALLMFVPVFNIVMMFILGAKGSAWAWRNRKWDSIAHFKKVQRQWSMWGFIIHAFLIALGAGLFFYYSAEMKNNDVYKLAVQKTEANADVSSLIGNSLYTGIPWDLEQSKQDEVVSFSFDVEGSVGEGTIWATAKKGPVGWKIIRMVLVKDGQDCSAPDVFDLINELTMYEDSQEWEKVQTS